MPLHPCKFKIGFIWSSTNQNEQNGTFVYQYPVAAARRQTSTFRRGCAIAELRPWLQIEGSKIFSQKRRMLPEVV